MDSDDFGAALIGMLFFLSLFLLIALVWLILEHPEVLENVVVVFWQGIEYLVTSIWKAHLAVGAAVVKLVRDRLVAKLWQDDYSGRAVRLLIVLWLTVVPFLLAFGLIVIAASFWSIVFWDLSAHDNALFSSAVFWGVLLMLPSIVAIVYGYYRYYFYGPLTHHRLVRFVKEYYLMRAEAQLAWLDFETRLKLLWFALKQQPAKDHPTAHVVRSTYE